jgi:hypothetical protein
MLLLLLPSTLLLIATFPSSSSASLSAAAAAASSPSSSSSSSSSSFPCKSVEGCLGLQMWHIPGPNPIVAPWNPDNQVSWMSTECEVAGGVQRVNDTSYVFVYHCTGTHSYRVGMSVASSPLGPWSKPPTSPNLDVTPNAWDKDVVASFNIIPDPEKPGAWLGYFEGGMPADQHEEWSMGVAHAASPLGPWKKSPNNPILQGNRTCDPSREFNKHCGGLYVASVLFGPHTNHEYWVYMEAPINQNDEGPLALWTSKHQEGPFKFRAYVLDGGEHPGAWDYGRYSESRVWYFNGLFHLFATGSPVGGPHENKLNEQIGWAVSTDGVNFTEYGHNPIAPWRETTPHTVAMSEGHVWFEDAVGSTSGMIYVYHTIRWITNSKNAFAPSARNNEDLGVEMFSVDPKFVTATLPLITKNWELDLHGGQTSPCLYDWTTYRYCVQVRVLTSNCL